MLDSALAVPAARMTARVVHAIVLPSSTSSTIRPARDGSRSAGQNPFVLDLGLLDGDEAVVCCSGIQEPRTPGQSASLDIAEGGRTGGNSSCFGRTDFWTGGHGTCCGTAVPSR